MLAVSVLITFAIVFWVLSMQIFGSLVLFSDRLVDREVLGFEIAASQLQGLPAIIMIALTPVVGYLWIWLGRRQKNPSTPVKFACSLVLAGGAFLMPAVGHYFSADGMQVALPWFLMIYLLMVTGELCQAPIALSMVTKLCPKRVVGMMIGANFVSLAIGVSVAGELAAEYTLVEQAADGSLVDPAAAMETYTSAYAMFGLTAIGLGVFLYLISPIICNRMHDHSEARKPSLISRFYSKLGVFAS